MKKYFITGVSGIGKTSVTRELQKRGFAAFDIEETNGLCYWVNKQTGKPSDSWERGNKEWFNEFAWVCNISKLEETIAKHNDDPLFLSGVTSNQQQFLHLFDKIFLLKAPEPVFLKRMKVRGQAGKSHFGYNQTERDIALDWYQRFEKELVDYGAIEIDASQPIKSVVDQIVSHIQ